MSFFSRIFEKKAPKEQERLLAAVINEGWLSCMYQDILKENDIPFVCYNHGAGGCFKIMAGGSFIADYIYVNPLDIDKAKELYEKFIVNGDAEIVLDSEEQ